VVVNQRNFHVENTDADPKDPRSRKGILHGAHTYEGYNKEALLPPPPPPPAVEEKPSLAKTLFGFFQSSPAPAPPATKESPRAHMIFNSMDEYYWMDHRLSLTTIFNFPLKKKGSTLDKKVILHKENQGSFLRLGCDMHEWEQAFFLPVRNPHYGMTGGDGSFKIENVPARKHRVIAWHPFAGQVEADVEVQDGATVTANFQIKK